MTATEKPVSRYQSCNETLKDWLQSAPYTIALSSCYFGFFAHIGILSVLEDHQLLPAKLSGASAGALAGSMWASGNSSSTLSSLLFTLTRDSFWDPSPGLGLLKGERFRNTIIEMAACTTLEQCNVPIAVSTFDLFRRKTHVFTAGNLAECVYASCTVPFLFQPIRVANTLCFDGGIKDWSGSAGVGAEERLLRIALFNRNRSILNALPCAKAVDNSTCRTVTISNLIPVSPNSMHNGQAAFYQARAAMQIALHKN
ncbi:MAG TPA: patatin [Crenotrichaceae bacterium]|nr:patatin [Crenotrichaceae bacterium]